MGLVEQLQKSDVAFNENIAKVSRTMKVIGNLMQQCVGILGNMAKLPNHTIIFRASTMTMSYFTKSGSILQKSVNQNEPYYEEMNTYRN